MTINTIKKLLPVFDHDSHFESYSARILSGILVLFGVIGIVYTIVSSAIDFAHILRYLGQGFFILLISFIGLLLIHKGHFRMAAILEIVAVWGLFSIAAYTGGGVTGSAYMGYMVVLVIAGVISGQRKDTIPVALLCIATGYFFVIANDKGFLPPSRITTTPLSVWVDSTVYFIIVAILQLISAQILYNALHRASRDLNQRRKAEEIARAAEATLQLALDAAHLATWEYDFGTQTFNCSPRYIEISGGIKPVDQFENVHPEDRPTVLNTMSEVVNGQKEGFAIIHRLLRPDGVVRWQESWGRISRDQNGQPVKLAGVMLDVTERRQAEDEIRLLNAKLEQRVEERTRQLEAVNKELEAFSFSVSHDLRAPLRAIEGYAQILSTDHAHEISPAAQELLAKVNQATARMNDLINALLDFARLGRQPIEKSIVNVRALVEMILTEFTHDIETRQVKFTIGNLPDCDADPRLLHQVFTNLLSNALKYTRTRPQACIEIGGQQQDGETTYYVRDNGVGFDMRHAGQLFNVFRRLHHEGEFEGTGIGLANVKRIIDRHGGHVWAEAELEKGATFSFALPTLSHYPVLHE